MTEAQKVATVKRNAEWRKAHPEETRAMRRAAYARNPEKWYEARRLRIARLAGAEGSHSVADIRAIRQDQDDCCLYCGDPLNGGGHVEHMIPLSRLGTNWPDNLCLACPGCNLRKGELTALEFIEREDPVARAA